MCNCVVLGSAGEMKTDLGIDQTIHPKAIQRNEDDMSQVPETCIKTVRNEGDATLS